jgi:hypothetical protein
LSDARDGDVCFAYFKAGLLEQAGWLVNDKRVERDLAARSATSWP